MIEERGQQDGLGNSAVPEAVPGGETIPGLTWPTITFHQNMTLWLGSREVRIIHAGRGHTTGDTIAWLPERFSTQAISLSSGPPYYCDAHFADGRRL